MQIRVSSIFGFVLALVLCGCNGGQGSSSSFESVTSTATSPELTPSLEPSPAPQNPTPAPDVPVFDPRPALPSYREAALGARASSLTANPSPSFSAFGDQNANANPLRVECDGQACPEGLASLESIQIEAAAGQLTKGQCNGFLLSPDTIATAWHCVPRDLQAAGKDCGNRLWFFFPKTANAPAEQVGCQKVEYLSPAIGVGTTKHPDYAFLRLARPVRRKPVTLDRGGVRNGQTVEIFHHRNTGWFNAEEKWKLGKIQCRIVQGTMLLPDFSLPLDTRMSLVDCPVVPGDSGSAIFNDRGEVVGILDSISTENMASPDLAALARLGLTATVPPFAFGKNFACIPDPTDERSSLPEACGEFSPG